MNNNELKHYGVLGMKWGRRKAQYNTSADHDRARQLEKKHVSEMSNKELRELNDRQQLESKHKQLNPSTIKKAVTVVTAVAAGLGAVALLHENSKKTIKAGKDVYNSYKEAKVLMKENSAMKEAVKNSKQFMGKNYKWLI